MLAKPQRPRPGRHKSAANAAALAEAERVRLQRACLRDGEHVIIDFADNVNQTRPFHRGDEQAGEDDFSNGGNFEELHHRPEMQQRAVWIAVEYPSEWPDLRSLRSLSTHEKSMRDRADELIRF